MNYPRSRFSIPPRRKKPSKHFVKELAHEIIYLLEKSITDFVRQKVNETINDRLENIIDDLDNRLSILEEKTEELEKRLEGPR